jgi:hypothetical protein
MKRWAIALVLVLAGCSNKASETKADAAAAAVPKDSGVPLDTISDESEREKYVSANLEVTGLDVGPDLKPGDDGGVVNVGGLFKVAGLVTNKGERAVKNAQITVSVLDASGKVIGTYFHDVVGNKRLAPGEQRPFKFAIPEKKEYAGKFTFTLR